MTTNQIAQLSDEALIEEASRAAGRERLATGDVLRLLMEVDHRRLYLARGYSSMFAYCTRALHYSEQAAYSRITAARATRRFPQLLDELDRGHLTLSSVGLLGPELTDDTVDTLIEAARGRSTREVERMIAGLHAQPDVESSVRALPVREHKAPISTNESDEGHKLCASMPVERLTSSSLPPRASSATENPRPVIAPLAPTRYLMKVTIDDKTHEKLQRLRDLMRHSVPSGDPAESIDRALTVLLEQVERQKVAKTTRPQLQNERAPKGRHIPAAVRRAIWARDTGRCAFDGTDGHCGESAFLEFHHVVPFAAGGQATVGNIQLRCRAHNTHEARIFLGTGGVGEQRPST